MPDFVLIDDHPIVLDGLTAVLGTRPAYRIVATGATVEAAEILVCQTNCDVLFADLRLMANPSETIRRIRSERSHLKIIIFTENACPVTCLDVMKAGANGFVLKDSTTTELFGAIETILAGQEFISPPLQTEVSREKELAKDRKQQLASLALSSREGQVAHELLHGATNMEIAVKLNISYKTVKFYMNQIMRKFDAKSRVEVVLELQRLNGPTAQSSSTM